MISDRLRLVADFVSCCESAADIGTDHAYVPIELVKSGKVKKVYAMDIHSGPLERAREHIRIEKLSEAIEVRQSNGLDRLCEHEADTVIIAGMGGALTVDILRNGEKILKTIKELVLSPHSEVFLVRRYLIEHGYAIIREKMICDAGKYYTVIKAVQSSDSEAEREIYEKDGAYYLYGRILIEEKDAVLREYLIWKKGQQEKILAALGTNKSDSARQRREELKLEGRQIDRVLKMIR